MPILFPLRFKCARCNTYAELEGSMEGLEGIPHQLRMTITEQHIPAGWHISLRYVGCPQHPEHLVQPIGALPHHLLAGRG